MQHLDRRWTTDFDLLQREMERYLQHLASKKPPGAIFSQRAWQPSADVYETEDSVVALFELPGVDQNDIELVVGRGEMTLRGNRRDSGARTDRRYSCLEIPFGPFERTVPLPAAVEPESASASFRAGFLEVSVDKLNAGGPRRVQVNPA
jgi:HSP20 family protein